VAASPLLDAISGRYFNDCHEAVSVDHRDMAQRHRRAVDRRSIAAYMS